ncbi:FGGY-family carbohydrate kinase [Nocardioides sp. SYSU D00065]|uniref:xylulokinase n=1 Tax=Nocardioides sp. SYSU D00065 TaxID=2817378 RepID=UPI001B32F2FC|nr:FGGY family carbohydrate kinase [Nocardioides sp. SYSU D00065]
MPEQPGTLVLALDLGTGGCKSSLWNTAGACVAQAVVDYATTHPRPGWNEQRPQDWWDAVVTSVRTLLAELPTARGAVAAVSVSGHSLGAVLLDASREVVGDTTPIWSDTRAHVEAAEFFTRVDPQKWYETTGNGFAPEMYPAFKAMWFQRHEPERWAATRWLLGSKDWINLRLTGQLATDHSYASGSGVYNLHARTYDEELMVSAGLDFRLLPPVREATDRVGVLTGEAGDALGLPPGVPVVAGGVDNACMALGSRGTRTGRVYASLGSSSWITSTGEKPVLDAASRPFVFAHVVPGLFISALSTFSTGTTITWLRDVLAPDSDVSDLLTEGCLAPPGADGLLFLPMLSGGTPLEGGGSVRGGLTGLDLMHTRAHVVRAAMEGVALSLRRGLDLLAEHVDPPEEVLLSGGGSRHPGWNQMYADIFDVPVVRTTVNQQAAALGAATLALVGVGAWDGFAAAEEAHRVEERHEPHPGRAELYNGVAVRFEEAVRRNASAARS